MRYIGFGVGHVDPAVRANPTWPGRDQSISEILQNVDIEEDLADMPGSAEDDNPVYESASEHSDDEVDDDPGAVDEDPYADI